MLYRIELTPHLGAEDGRGQALRRACRGLGLDELPAAVVSDLHFLSGDLSLSEAEALARDCLLDPVADELSVAAIRTSAGTNDAARENKQPSIEVTFLPGVTDSVSDSLLAMAHRLGNEGVQAAASGRRYRFLGAVDVELLERIASELLANSTVQRYVVNAPIEPPFVDMVAATGRSPLHLIEGIPIRDLDDDALAALSRERRLSLDLAEMRAIQAYYRAEDREPTDVELETVAQTWSEHCVHKTFKAEIEYIDTRDERRETGDERREAVDGSLLTSRFSPLMIDGLLKTYIRAATEQIAKPWVRSAFVDNAGIVAFNDTFDLAFKVETHNHPSALEPFGGANTGVGGVIRDILGVSAKPIANTDVLCFGPPDLAAAGLPVGVLHPRRVADGVIHGIEDYGNKMGIPTVNGAVHYHPSYTANPLVYCGCLGILPHGSHRSLHEAQAGDLIIAIGGRTGRDGLRGATFSSMEMDHTTGAIASTAVQIGNPIVEKQVLEVILAARDAELYHAVTDCGAGGFSSAVGEMGEHVGARVQLQNAPLKYPGLRPWEIWLSEAQERMVLAVPPGNWEAFQAICREHDVEASMLGTFDGSGRLRIEHSGTPVGELDMHFLHNGIPRRRLSAVWTPPNLTEPVLPEVTDLAPVLVRLLAHPNIRSRAPILHLYDHEVQGGTVVKPLAGAAQQGPSDAAVLVPQPVAGRGWRVAGGELEQFEGTQPEVPARLLASHLSSLPGVALSAGINPRYGLLDPYAMAWACVDEAFRNAVAVGADPDRIALLDNFCWGNPNLADRLGSLVRCAQGCYDAALTYQAPFVSGKDSLNNEYTGDDGKKHAIPGTLLISALSILPDVNRTITSDLKTAGNYLYLLGETRSELGGSVYYDLYGELGASAPQPYSKPLERMRALHGAIAAGLVRAAHDLSEGGLAVALAEMCIGGNMGAEISLSSALSASRLSTLVTLFSESLGRFLIEVAPVHTAGFEAIMVDQPLARIGIVTADKNVRVTASSGLVCINAPVSNLTAAFVSAPQYPHG